MRITLEFDLHAHCAEADVSVGLYASSGVGVTMDSRRRLVGFDATLYEDDRLVS